MLYERAVEKSVCHNSPQLICKILVDEGSINESKTNRFVEDCCLLFSDSDDNTPSAVPYQRNFCNSLKILEEYREVLKRPKFGFDASSVDTFLQDIEKAAVMIYPTKRVRRALDEPDNRFLECAKAAKAHYLVTGNKKHFPFPELKGTKIVSSAEFAARLFGA